MLPSTYPHGPVFHSLVSFDVVTLLWEYIKRDISAMRDQKVKMEEVKVSLTQGGEGEWDTSGEGSG